MVANTSNGCPYKGLQPYTEEDREYFFGRKRDTEVISSNLYIVPLTILYGTSGVGKSSVLQAGVIPHLREDRRVIVLLFNNWQGDNFNIVLKERVLQAICSSTGKTPPDVFSEISKELSREVTGVDGLPLDELISSCATVFRRRILMIFDQFEEYFLYHSATAGAEGFDAEFARAVNHSESGVNFMLAMREEELSKLDRFRPRIPNLLSNLLRLENLDSEAAKDAILEPLPIYNQRHPAAEMNIEPELVSKIIKQVRPDYVKQHVAAGPISANGEATRTQPKADRIETPFLQLVLIRLWDAEKQKQSRTLRVSTFEELGGALEIARTHLDKVMSQVTESQRATAAAVLRFLVTPTGSKIALDAESLASFANANKDDVLEVLDLLGSGKEMRILRKVTTHGQADRYELFHDVLGPAILDWRSRYVQAQQLIQEREQAEKEFSIERQRRLRQAILVLVLLLLVMAGTTVYALSQRSEARKQASAAEKQRLAAVAQYNDAQQQRSKAEEQRGIADQAFQEASKAKKDLEIAKQESDRQKDIAVLARQQEAAARRIAEAAKKRADHQAAIATNLVKISEFNLKGFDAARLGNTDEAIVNFKQAFNLSSEQKNNATEAYALINMADAYGTKGAAIPLELFDLFDKYDGTNYEDLFDTNYQAQSYAAKIEQALKDQKRNNLRTDQADAIKSYQAAIEANRRQQEPDLKREAWIQQRIGDLQLTSQFFLLADKQDDSKLDLGPVVKAYNDASDSYSRAGLWLEEGILQTRIAFLSRMFTELKDADRDEQAQNAISAYERALKAFHTAGSRSREAVTLVRLGETYTEFSTGSPERLNLAISYYTKGAELYAQLGNHQKEGATYSDAAELCTRLSPPDKDLAFNNYTKAITAFQAAQRSLFSPAKSAPSTEKQKEIEKQREEVQTLVLTLVDKIGALYVQDPKPQANLSEYFKGLVASYGSDNQGKASALQKIAEVYNHELKDKLEAINFYRAQSELWQESGSLLKQAQTLVTIGSIFHELDDSNTYHELDDRANMRSSFEEARSIYKDLSTNLDNDTRNQVSDDLIAIAKTYSESGEKRLAFETYQQALHLFEAQSVDLSPGSYQFNKIGDIVRSVVKVLPENEAAGFFQRLSTFYHSKGDISSEGSSLELAGDLYAGWGKIADALNYYNLALNLRPTPSAVVGRIGKVYYNAKDEAGAKKFFTAVIDAYHNRKDSTGEGNALIAVADFYRELGNTGEAINYYTDGTRILCRKKAFYSMGNAFRSLSSILDGLGEKDEAARLRRFAVDPSAIADCDIQIRRRH